MQIVRSRFLTSPFIVNPVNIHTKNSIFTVQASFVYLPTFILQIVKITEHISSQL